MVAAPVWLRLVRAGQTVSAFSSANGTTWTPVGQATIAMTTAVHVGVAVSSHDASRTATATFDRVNVTD
jgi:regulation of enolase protein 1 (concanavalin A-like superfamily)